MVGLKSVRSTLPSCSISPMAARGGHDAARSDRAAPNAVLFDTVESDGKLKFRKRAEPGAHDSSELGAHEVGSDVSQFTRHVQERSCRRGSRSLLAKRAELRAGTNMTAADQPVAQHVTVPLAI
jgi:hypothetical protein